MNIKPSVVLIFDIGKTNKKAFLFNEDYNILWSYTNTVPLITDEDGDECENADALQLFVKNTLQQVFNDDRFEVKAINISAYGATLVHLDEKGKLLTPIYSYLKNYPQHIAQEFIQKYSGQNNELFLQTASPLLYSLNSGLQLYRIKKEQPLTFKAIRHSLHLPQYIHWLICQNYTSECTSIGCHTMLWNFQKQQYHEWVEKENLLSKFPAPQTFNSTIAFKFNNKEYKAGIGMHDSSAALLPYLESFKEPFVLISTGTWCITLNPFNKSSLTVDELRKDCLCYITYNGDTVKASRAFLGADHEQQVNRIAEYFKTTSQQVINQSFNTANLNCVFTNSNVPDYIDGQPFISVFEKRPLHFFKNIEQAYLQLIQDIVVAQQTALQLVTGKDYTGNILIDGGFAENQLFMHLLKIAFPFCTIYAASVPQSTALGAALSIHTTWNSKLKPSKLISLKQY